MDGKLIGWTPLLDHRLLEGPHDVRLVYESPRARVKEERFQVVILSDTFYEFAEPLMRESPAPRCRLRELGDSSLNYELMGWVDDPSLRGRCTDQVLAAIYKRLMAEGIEIPYPKRDVIISYAEALPEPGDEGPATAAG